MEGGWVRETQDLALTPRPTPLQPLPSWGSHPETPPLRTPLPPQPHSSTGLRAPPGERPLQVHQQVGGGGSEAQPDPQDSGVGAAPGRAVPARIGTGVMATQLGRWQAAPRHPLCLLLCSHTCCSGTFRTRYSP